MFISLTLTPLSGLTEFGHHWTNSLEDCHMLPATTTNEVISKTALYSHNQEPHPNSSPGGGAYKLTFYVTNITRIELTLIKITMNITTVLFRAPYIGVVLRRPSRLSRSISKTIFIKGTCSLWEVVRLIFSLRLASRCNKWRFTLFFWRIWSRTFRQVSFGHN